MFASKFSSVFVLLFGLSTAMWLHSCDEPLPEPIDARQPFQYYPLDTGKYIVYQVDSIIYNETFANDTTQWQVMELIADTMYDLNGRLNYVIERYRRPDVASDWQLTHIWQVLMTDGKVEKIENNLRFVKLVTPLLENVQWDGNVYLGGLEDIPVDYECNRLSFYEGWLYTYRDLEAPFSVNGLDFPHTVTVTQEGDSNLIWFDYAKEIYAENVGLVWKEFYHFYTQDITCPACPWEERVQCGYSVKMSVLEYN